jgi:hypothetical protein
MHDSEHQLVALDDRPHTPLGFTKWMRPLRRSSRPRSQVEARVRTHMKPSARARPLGCRLSSATSERRWAALRTTAHDGATPDDCKGDAWRRVAIRTGGCGLRQGVHRSRACARASPRRSVGGGPSLLPSRPSARRARAQRQAGVRHLGRHTRQPLGVAHVYFLRNRSSACRCRVDAGGSRLRP